MRLIPAVITVSVIANAVLGVVFWQRTSAPSNAAPTHNHAGTHPNISPAATTPAAFAARCSQLAHDPDDATALAFLRSSGFPPEIVRSLMVERIRARYQPRISELDARRAETPYWRARNLYYGFDDDVALRAERRALEREIADTLRQVLGDAAETLHPYERERRARSYGDLPPSKVAEIEAINRDYSELTSQIRERSKGAILPEDREQLAFLEKEKRADLVASLTPEQLEEYDRRNSPAAGEIRNKLRYFEATESEFVALYHAQRDFDARYGRDNLSGEQQDRRRAALPELTEQFRAALGPERFAEFELLTDGNYRNTHSFVLNRSLPADTARELVVTQRATNQRADAIRSDKSLTPEQRTAQLADLEKEAVAKVTAAVGADHFNDYKQNAGHWLNRIAPPQKPAAR